MVFPSPTSWFSSSKPQPADEASLHKSLSSYVSEVNLGEYATPQVVTAFAMGVVSAIGAAALRSRYFNRIRTAEWVHPSLLRRRKWIKGVVTSVGDAGEYISDNFRFYHTPGPFWRWPLRLRKVPKNVKDLKDETIHIRMGGIDAPEASHFGKPAQPYASEALAWLKNEVEGKRLWVQMIRRDQYGRIVSIPIHPPRIPIIRPPASRCVSISMLRAGFATTYEQSGAEYGPWGKDVFTRYEGVARASKRGMWASKTLLESPSDYKKRHKEGTEGQRITVGNSSSRSPAVRKTYSWFTTFIPWR